jgi:hypothetical protein
MEEFRPQRAIVLSELSTKKKEVYYQLLLANDAKFKWDSEGRFVANLRLVSGDVRRSEAQILLRKRDKTMDSIEERLMHLERYGVPAVTVRVPAAAESYYNNVSSKAGGSVSSRGSSSSGAGSFDYARYGRFAALVSSPGDVVKPKVHPLSWTMKLIDDLYDSRFLFEKNQIQKGTEDLNSGYSGAGSCSLYLKNMNQLMKSNFPLFVAKRLNTTHGLTHVVDQLGWDLVYNVQIRRYVIHVNRQ